MSRARVEEPWLSRVGRAALALVWIGVLTTGCSDEESADGLIDDIQTNQTLPDDFAGALAAAWSEKSVGAMDALLASNFEFVILDEDSEDLAWVTDGRWDRAQEMTIVENMMNVNYSGDELPVDTIEMEFSVLGSKVSDGAFDTLADAEITILIGPDEGWFSDTRFALALREDADGFLRLIEMDEVRALFRSSPASASVEEASFSSMKAVYR